MGLVDALFCAGDAVYGYRFSNPVIDILRERGAYMVMGNHDYDFLQVHKERNGTNGYVSPENMAFMTTLPRILNITLDGKRITMVHATPFPADNAWYYYNEYIFKSSPKFKDLAKIDTDILIMGHTHQAHVERVGDVLVINPGSCGESRDPNKPKLSYAILDVETEDVQICYVDESDQARGLMAYNDKFGGTDVSNG